MFILDDEEYKISVKDRNRIENRLEKFREDEEDDKIIKVEIY